MSCNKLLEHLKTSWRGSAPSDVQQGDAKASLLKVHLLDHLMRLMGPDGKQHRPSGFL